MGTTTGVGGRGSPKACGPDDASHRTRQPGTTRLPGKPPLAGSGPAEAAPGPRLGPGGPQRGEGRGGGHQGFGWKDVGGGGTPRKQRQASQGGCSKVRNTGKKAQETKAEKVPALTGLLLCSHPFPLPPRPLTPPPTAPESSSSPRISTRTQLPAPVRGPTLCRRPRSQPPAGPRTAPPCDLQTLLSSAPHCCRPCSSLSELRDPQNGCPPISGSRSPNAHALLRDSDRPCLPAGHPRFSAWSVRPSGPGSQPARAAPWARPLPPGPAGPCSWHGSTSLSGPPGRLSDALA